MPKRLPKRSLNGVWTEMNSATSLFTNIELRSACFSQAAMPMHLRKNTMRFVLEPIEESRNRE
jgi:hypothetical protein